MNSDPKAVAGQKLDALIRWARLTFIVTSLGVVVLVGAIGYAGLEYWRFKGAVTSAVAEFDKGAAELKKNLGRRP